MRRYNARQRAKPSYPTCSNCGAHRERYKQLCDDCRQYREQLRIQRSYDQRTAQHIAYERRTQRRYQDRLDAIPATHTGPWTSAEDALVGRDDLSLRQICYMLGRSYGAVSNRRIALRRGPIDYSRSRGAYTLDDDEVVRRYNATEAARITGRTKASIYNRRYELGITRRPCRAWTDMEVAVLRTCTTPEEAAAALDRTIVAVQHRANRIGHQWAPRPPRKECAAGHSLTGDNLFLNTAGVRLCRICARTYNTEWARCKRGSKPRNVRHWTPGDDAIAADLSLTSTEVAHQLGRTVKSIQMRRFRLKKRSTPLPVLTSALVNWQGRQYPTSA